MTQVEVKSSDVVKLILQYLRDNNLHQSFHILQKEAKVSLNIVDTNKFTAAIKASKWEEVLTTLNFLSLNQEHLFNLYELIIDDLLEYQRYQAAQHIIVNFLNSNIKNRQNYQERILRMEYIIQHPQEKALHKKVVTEHRKQEIIKQCLFEIHEEVENSRLLKLLTQAIKYQSNEGVIKPNIKLDLFEGKQQVVTQQPETIIKSVQKVVKYSQEAKVNCLALSWGEQLLALGGFDGLIQIYNTTDYSYHTGLRFQAEGTALFHEHPVTLMEFNHSDQMLVSSDAKNLVKIWNLENGKLLRKIQLQHGVGSLAWGMDPSHLAVGHQDIKLFGIKSCLVLKEYNVSGGDYIHKLLISQNKIFAITNGGLVRIFNYSNQEQLTSINLRQTVLGVQPIYASRGGSLIDKVLVMTPSKVFQLNRSGQQQARHPVEGGQLVAASCTGQFLYQFIKMEDKRVRLNVVSRSTSKNVYYCVVDQQVVLAVQQRQRNLLIAYDSIHNLQFWRDNN